MDIAKHIEVNISASRTSNHQKVNNQLLLPEHQGSFSAGLLTAGETTHDQYLFLATSEKIDSNIFHQLMPEINSSQRNNFSLPVFLQWLDQQHFIGATSLQVETVAR